MEPRSRDSIERGSSTTVYFSHISRGGVFSGRRSSLSYPVSGHGSSGTLQRSLPFVRLLSHALGHRARLIPPIPRYQHPHLPCPVLRLQVCEEDQDPQVGRDGLRHRYPNTRGDGSSRSATQEYLGEDRFLYFLTDRYSIDEIALLPPSCDPLFSGEGVLCVLYGRKKYIIWDSYQQTDPLVRSARMQSIRLWSRIYFEPKHRVPRSKSST